MKRDGRSLVSACAEEAQSDTLCLCQRASAGGQSGIHHFHRLMHTKLFIVGQQQYACVIESVLQQLTAGSQQDGHAFPALSGL